VSLTEFLLARIAEDEARARPMWELKVRQRIIGVPIEPRSWPTPDRVLAEVEAKRQIVHLHSGPDYWKSPDFHLCVDSMTDNDECETLHALAMPYADHPDFRDEWRVTG